MDKFNNILKQRIEFHKDALSDLCKNGYDLIDFLSIPFDKSLKIKVSKKEQLELKNMIDRVKKIQHCIYNAINENPKDY